MENEKKIILHIVFDGILFDGVSNLFDQMDGYKSIYLLNCFGDATSFKYIKNTSKVIVAKDEEEWGNIVSNPSIDIIYFHGLWAGSTKAIRYIRDNVVVIWWCYGMEIYERSLYIAPLLPIKLYMPKTFWLWQMINLKIHRFISSNFMYFCPALYNHIIAIKSPQKTKEIFKMIKRVDYLFTPLETEYEELKQRNKLIRAKPFRLFGTYSPQIEPVSLHKNGSILLDHSAVITNNHMDIFNSLKKHDLSTRTVYIPICYGDDFVKKRIKKYAYFNGAHTCFIENPLPFNEYQTIIRNCSHAFFGGIRQTALGNINICLRNGVKVFFFKNSILYKHFSGIGFYVYSIEENLTEEEINTPLTSEEMMHNHRLYCELHGVSHGTYQQQFDKLLSEHSKQK